MHTLLLSQLAQTFKLKDIQEKEKPDLLLLKRLLQCDLLHVYSKAALAETKFPKWKEASAEHAKNSDPFTPSAH